MGGSIEHKIFMVSIDSDDVRGRQENMPPSTKSMDDREKFPIVDVVVPFCLVERMGYASNGSKLSPVILL